jgi:hypothetical protein
MSELPEPGPLVRSLMLSCNMPEFTSCTEGRRAFVEGNPGSTRMPEKCPRAGWSQRFRRSSTDRVRDDRTRFYDIKSPAAAYAPFAGAQVADLEDSGIQPWTDGDQATV